MEPICSDRCPGLEKTFEGTTDISPSRVDLFPCLPDVVVRELERFLRLDRAVTKERRFRTG